MTFSPAIDTLLSAPAPAYQQQTQQLQQSQQDPFAHQQPKTINNMSIASPLKEYNFGYNRLMQYTTQPQQSQQPQTQPQPQYQSYQSYQQQQPQPQYSTNLRGSYSPSATAMNYRVLSNPQSSSSYDSPIKTEPDSSIGSAFTYQPSSANSMTSNAIPPPTLEYSSSTSTSNTSTSVNVAGPNGAFVSL
ncbi:unnamed protein product [Ambrosiozyma monospora]|uniref:Unnamed protein product n=1 Tax=Ambrosiozyma monospora TaxID=43982 RepID=A0ACB5UCS3_AMBMO|nr:unnamed protein product [Ambrosiozyma monospora]